MEDINFLAGKILWLVLQPSHFLLFVLILSFFLSWPLVKSVLQITVTAILFICLLLPIGDWLLLPLEQCFVNRQPFAGKIDGAVVLGGAVDARLTTARKTPVLNDAAERVMAAIATLNNYPDHILVYSGGSGSPFTKNFDEASAVKNYLQNISINTEKFYPEGHSRNTAENAINAVTVIGNDVGKNWLLITSAFHLPRAMALFEKAGLASQIHFYPVAVDYRTIGWWRFEPSFDLTANLAKADIAIKEYLGLYLNKIMGKTDTMWPCKIEKKGLL